MYQVREANQMVEEFMLAANMSVAGKILKEFPSCSMLRYVNEYITTFVSPQTFAIYEFLHMTFMTFDLVIKVSF